MPEISENTHLKDLIGTDSLASFEKPLAECFLIDLPKVWAEVEDYKLFQIYVKKMQCINDVTERALGMANTVVCSTSTFLQYTYSESYSDYTVHFHQFQCTATVYFLI